MSQPTLSQQIRRLEETLGGSLFDRTSRTVRPTDAGEACIGCARWGLVALEAGKRTLHNVKELPLWSWFWESRVVDVSHRLTGTLHWAPCRWKTRPPNRHRPGRWTV
ncbi:hypothetical protein EMIT0P100_190041 [Pseudomonas sp. IT-P100]